MDRCGCMATVQGVENTTGGGQRRWSDSRREMPFAMARYGRVCGAYSAAGRVPCLCLTQVRPMHTTHNGRPAGLRDRPLSVYVVRWRALGSGLLRVRFPAPPKAPEYGAFLYPDTTIVTGL